MFWLIEGKDKFKEFCNRGFEEAFVEIIPLNHFQHPIKNSICAFYIRPLKESKGYMLPIAHGECINLFEDEVYLELKKLKKIYVRDKKDFLHYTILKSLYDVTLTLPTYIPPITQAHNFIYRNFPTREDTNAIVPITKHYEVCAQIYDDVEHRINTNVNTFYNDKASLVFNAIERNGLKINKNDFAQHFHPVEDEFVHTSYNFKTLTTRPSNTFGGVNFAALPKENGCRQSFIPRNSSFMEFDISAYHPNLAARLVDYDFGEGDVHQSFADMYGVDYKKSKELTFRQLYGGVFAQYKDLPFFKLTSLYIQIIWDEFQKEGKLICPISNYVFEKDKLEEMNPQKLFNYVLQNMETSVNIQILFRIFTLLKGMNTKLVLYTYDSFLFDVDDSEIEVMERIKEVFNKLKLRITEKNGTTYNFT
tara:strand:+ start:4148 stop:5407 length:1260 start_codon:yes stop_codon:yes gene_type:complete